MLCMPSPRCQSNLRICMFTWLKVSSCRTNLHRQQTLRAQAECEITWTSATFCGEEGADQTIPIERLIKGCSWLNSGMGRFMEKQKKPLKVRQLKQLLNPARPLLLLPRASVFALSDLHLAQLEFTIFKSISQLCLHSFILYILHRQFHGTPNLTKLSSSTEFSWCNHMQLWQLYEDDRASSEHVSTCMLVHTWWGSPVPPWCCSCCPSCMEAPAVHPRSLGQGAASPTFCSYGWNIKDGGGGGNQLLIIKNMFLSVCCGSCGFHLKHFPPKNKTVSKQRSKSSWFICSFHFCFRKYRNKDQHLES